MSDPPVGLAVIERTNSRDDPEYWGAILRGNYPKGWKEEARWNLNRLLIQQQQGARRSAGPSEEAIQAARQAAVDARNRATSFQRPSVPYQQFGATTPQQPRSSAIDYINTAQRAGLPYVNGGLVYNTPASAKGMDYNVSTGQWIPNQTQGTFNGMPINDYLNQARMDRMQRINTLPRTPPTAVTPFTGSQTEAAPSQSNASTVSQSQTPVGGQSAVQPASSSDVWRPGSGWLPVPQVNSLPRIRNQEAMENP